MYDVERTHLTEREERMFAELSHHASCPDRCVASLISILYISPVYACLQDGPLPRKRVHGT